MKVIKHSVRALTIVGVAIRYSLGDVLLTLPYLAPLRWTRYVNPWYWAVNCRLSQGERVRMALERLGPIFVKFGQILSTRYDMLPEAMLLEFAKLRDRVPPFSSAIARQLIEAEFKQPVDQVFAHFDDQPLASASIAQVHAATLHSGESVVVKLLRPGIKKAVERDLAMLAFGAALLEKYCVRSRRLKPVAMVAEVTQCFTDEVNLMLEAANASQLKQHMQGDAAVYIPTVYWDYCHPTILVTERVKGTSVANLEALKAQGVDLKQLAVRGLETFFTQIFRDRYFHADLHPGNIFIDCANANAPRYQLVDFGIMGALSDVDQRYIAENLLAFLKRDYHKVAVLHIECGWVPATARVDQFEAAIRAVCEPIFNRPIKEISLGRILVGLIQTARRFEMNIQPQLILLQKTLLQIEGLCRELDPELNMWVTVRPIIEKWLKQKLGPKALLRKVKGQLPLWLERAPELPELIHAALLERQQPVITEKVIERRHSPWLALIFLLLLLVVVLQLNTALLPLWAMNGVMGVALFGVLCCLLFDQ